MPCHSAMNEKPLTISSDEEVGDVLKKMKKGKAQFAVVLDDEGVAQGLFSYDILLKNLLPVSVAMDKGISLDITVRAAPGVAKRLKKVYPLPISDIMERKLRVVHPETPTWEGIKMLMTHGVPLIVVEPKTGKLVGLMTGETAVEELQRIKG